MPRTQDGLMRFFREWLNFGSSIEIYNNPLYGSARPYIETEVSLFLRDVLWNGDGRLATMLTAPYSFINAPLAAVYGEQGVSGNDLVKRTLNPLQRSGLLTMPIFMANTSFPDGTIRPVMRGKYIRQRLLCQEMPPPPPEANTMAPVISAGASTRQHFIEHARDPFCAGCHRLMDPIGLAFDRYQATGTYRTIDSANPGPDGDDDTGHLYATDVDGMIKGVPDLGKKLASSEQVLACAASQWVRYALGLDGESEESAQAAEELAVKLANSKGDLRVMFNELVQTQAFRFIAKPDKGACQ